MRQTNGHLQTPQTLHYDKLTLFGAYGLRRRDYADALHMIADRRIEVASMVTHRFGPSGASVGMRGSCAVLFWRDHRVRRTVLFSGSVACGLCRDPTARILAR